MTHYSSAPHDIPELNVKDNVLFMYYLLSRASDKQLAAVHMKTEQRDSLLKRGFMIQSFNDYGNYQDRQILSCFNPTLSNRSGISFINYNMQYDQPLSTLDSLSTWAHETYHAACHWENADRSASRRKHALFAENSFGKVGTIFSGIKFAHHYYREELEAMRFESYFNPRNYVAPFENKTPDDPLYSEILGDYPTPRKIQKIYAETAKECLKGNLFFPNGLRSIHEEHEQFKKDCAPLLG